MLRIKRLYIFIIQTFFPVFLMTIVICLFILLMQFLWRYIEDLVGKGLDNSVIAELFFYALLNLIPMALPLSILLASLMTFGNMGERLELLSIKASGVSLLKAMRPLIIFVSAVAIGAFFFQNEAMPRINVKFKTLLSSIKHKSPELEIPEGSFYSGIRGYSIYVSKKNPETKILHNMMIYDTSNGFSNMTVTVCDSARMRVSIHKDYLLLNLYNGKRFANLKNGTIDLRGQGNSYSSRRDKFVPYYREQFKEESIIIPFEGSFDRMDESVMDDHQSAKNIAMLNKSIDSLKLRIDTLNSMDRQVLKNTYLSYRNEEYNPNARNTIRYKNTQDSLTFVRLNFDSVVASYNNADMERIYEQAASGAERGSSNYMFQIGQKADIQRSMRYHEIELHRKFTLSFACLIFFFIGAPLGAIIRKGGLGMPVIVSVLFFIVYYIFDNVGIKMARDGVWEVWQGMWLSSMILFPIGVFLTYKAMNDSDLFNAEVYGKYLRKILNIKTGLKEIPEIDIDPDKVPSLSDINADPKLIEYLSAMDINHLKDIAKNYKQYGYDDDTLNVILSILKEKGDSFFGVRIKNLDGQEAKRCLSSFIGNAQISRILYIAAIIFIIANQVLNIHIVSWATILVNLAYILFFIRTCIYYSDFYAAIDHKNKIKEKVIRIIELYILNIFFYPLLKKEMVKDMDSIKW